MSVYATTGVPHSATSYTTNLINSISGDLVLNPAGDINLSGKKIVNAATPSGPDDGVTKSYADTTYATAPVSAVTDNALVTYDGNTGKLIKQSVITDTNGTLGNIAGINPTTGGTVDIGGNVNVSGNLNVTGTTTTINTDQMLVKDNTVSLNNGYTQVTTKTSGVITNYSVTATTTTVATGGFTAGVTGVSNPTVATTDDVFVAGDIIQISEASSVANNGLFEVQSNAGGVLTIRGVGTTALTYDILQNQFVTDTTIAGTIYKVNISGLQIDGPNINMISGNLTSAMIVKKVVGCVTSVVDAIGVFSDTNGTLDAGASSTPATLSRPMTISSNIAAGVGVTSGTFNIINNVTGGGLLATLGGNSNSRQYIHLYNSGTGKAIALRFGLTASQTSPTYLLGVTSSIGGVNDFHLYNYGVSRQSFTISPTTNLISVTDGMVITRIDFTAVATNPGATGTVWTNSGDSNRLYHGANKLAYTSEISTGGITATSPVANSLVAFADSLTGNVKSPDSPVTSTQSFTIDRTTTTTDTILSLKRIGTNTTGFALQVLPTIDANIIYFNGQENVAGGIQYFKAGKARWAIVNDCNSANDNFKIERDIVGNRLVPMVIDASDGVIQAPLGIRCTPTSQSNGFMVVGPGIASTSSGTIILQALTGGDQGMSALNFNGYYPGSETRFNTGKNRWRLMVDQRSSTDTMSIDTWNGTTQTVCLSIATTGIMTANAGIASTRHDIISTGSNPGSTNTVWYNSGSDSLRSFFGANKLGLFADSPNGNKQEFVTTGISYVTMPSASYGYRMISIYIMGGGGGGSSPAITSGGGGGSSGTGYLYTMPLDLNDTISFNLGAGGTAANAGGGAGGAGGSSTLSVNGVVVVTVTGGSGGTALGLGGNGYMPGGGGWNGTVRAGGTTSTLTYTGVTVANAESGSGTGTGFTSTALGGRGLFGGSGGSTNSGSAGSESRCPGGGGGGPLGGSGGSSGAGSAGTKGCGGGGGAGYYLAGAPNLFGGGAGGPGYACVWFY